MIGTKHVAIFETTGKGIFARVGGKVSFPRRDGQQPVVGEVWSVEVTGENAGKTVYFLQLLEKKTGPRRIGYVPVKGGWYKNDFEIWISRGMKVVAAQKGSGRFAKGWELAIFTPETSIQPRATAHYVRVANAAPLVVYEGDGGYVTGRGFSSKGGATDSYAVAYQWYQTSQGYIGPTMALDFSPLEDPERFLRDVVGMPDGPEAVVAWLTAKREKREQAEAKKENDRQRHMSEYNARVAAARQLGESIPISQEVAKKVAALATREYPRWYSSGQYTASAVGWYVFNDLWIGAILHRAGDTRTYAICVGGPFKTQKEFEEWVGGESSTSLYSNSEEFFCLVHL